MRKRQIVLLLVGAGVVAAVSLVLLGGVFGRVLHFATYATRPLWDSGEGSFSFVVAFYPPPMDPIKPTITNTIGTIPHDSRLCRAHGWRSAESNDRRVFDVSLFSVELDMLELRFRELMDVTDIFVVAESNTTFTGLSKNMTFANNRARFEFVKDKI
ncbi:hypothetical protein HK100_010855, partial [Physocladia obscura]